MPDVVGLDGELMASQVSQHGSDLKVGASHEVAKDWVGESLLEYQSVDGKFGDDYVE